MSNKLPAGGQPDGDGVLLYPEVSAAADAVRVDLYEDFQCPYCRELERFNGETIKTLARQGRIRVAVHLMTFLDDNFGNDSSRRAANAAYGAADAGRFADFHSTVFANQAGEGVGYSDEDLLRFGQQSGIEGAAFETFSAVVRDGSYADYVSATEDRAERDGVQGTPGVFFDGRQLADPEAMQALLSQTGSFEVVLDEL